jgi:putative ABC transport system permease protein
MFWLLQDVQFGLRAISKDRSFFFTSVLALALGIGATTVIFSVIDNILLNPFPYLDSQHIYDMQIKDRTVNASAARNWFSIPEFLDFQQQNRIFDRSLGVWEQTTMLGDPSSPESLDTDLVTGNTFQFLGVPPLLGRGILPSDAQPGASPVFVLSYKTWVKHFGLDPAILGKTFLLNNTPTTLIGIMPPRFAFWGGDIWMPAVLDRAHPGNNRFVLYGHLKPGLNPKAAQGAAYAAVKRIAQTYPDLYPRDFTVTIESLGEQTVGRFKPTLYLLLASVSMILLIACANVANLLLAQATKREKEFSLRRALGATRFRIITQLMVESLLLALAGAIAGCLLAAAGLTGLLRMLPQFTFPDEAVVSLNTEVLLAAVATAMATALLFGLAPGLMASGRQFEESIKTGSRGNTGFRQGRLRNIFVVSQVALSLLLLTSAGLLIRSFFLQHEIDLGLRTDHLLVSNLNLPAASYNKPAAQSRFVSELLARLERVPGVLSAAAALEIPPRGALPTDFDISGIPHTSVWKGMYSPCSRGYFETVGLHRIAGRVPTAAEENQRRQVAVINRSLATRYFGDSNPIGRRLRLAALKSGSHPIANPWFEIIGVVSDMKNNGPRESVTPAVYVPYTISDFSGFNIYLHTVSNPAALGSTLTKQVLTLDRTVFPMQTLTMDDILEITEYARPRFGLILILNFASIGLILAAVGVYSVTAYSVTQQQKEIGIRMALGAKPLDIRAFIIRRSMRFVLIGVAVGICLASFATRVLASQIWGISPHDSITFIAVIAVLTGMGLLASYFPSRRAARIDPAICLRSE